MVVTITGFPSEDRRENFTQLMDEARYHRLDADQRDTPKHPWWTLAWALECAEWYAVSNTHNGIEVLTRWDDTRLLTDVITSLQELSVNWDISQPFHPAPKLG